MAISVVVPVEAQTVVMDRGLVVIDPAHGGTDAGGRISGQIAEKDVTLALAGKLQVVLSSRGFRIAMTRSGDLDAGSPDQRAEAANRTRAVACMTLHASTGTNGVVLGTSALGTALMRTMDASGGQGGAVPWGCAQQVYVAQSDRLANQAGTALARSSIPVTIMRVEMRPLDSLLCPAISVELGVLPRPDTDALQVSDDGYQQRVAEALADALDVWRKLAQPPGYADPRFSDAIARPTP